LVLVVLVVPVLGVSVMLAVPTACLAVPAATAVAAVAVVLPLRSLPLSLGL
jgi:hypothetical protein